MGQNMGHNAHFHVPTGEKARYFDLFHAASDHAETQ
jgi:hypothetical protein